MFNAYSIGVSISLMNKVSPVLSRIINDFAKTDEQAQKFQKRLDSIKAGFVGSFGAISAGVAIAAAFKAPIQEAEKFERAMLRIRNIGGIDNYTLAGVRSNALSGKYKGIGATESVDLFRDLHAAFGEADKARELMPQFAEFARITQATFGKSGVAGEEDVKALAKFAERRGGTKSPQAMAEQLDLAMRIGNASGGAVTPKDLLAFQAKMGAAGILLSNDGLTKMWALMQEQGGSAAGNALNSGLQNIVFGRGTEASGITVHKLGWVDEKINTKHLKERFGDHWESHKNKVMGSSLIDSDLMKRDTVGWMLKDGLPLISKYLDKMGITDPEKRKSETISLMVEAFSNRKGQDSFALIATQMERIMKDAGLAVASKGLKESGDNLDNSPLSKIQDLHARWETGLTNLGESALPVVIPMMEHLTESLKQLNKYAEKNPDSIRRVSAALLGLSAVLVGGGMIGIIHNTVKSFKLLGQVLRVFPVDKIGQVTTGLSKFGAAFLRLAPLMAAYVGMELGEYAANKINKKIQESSGNGYSSMRDWFNDTGFGRSTGWFAHDPNEAMHFIQAPSKKQIAVNVYNKVDERGITTMVTKGQSKEASRPQSGMRHFDGLMSMRPVGAY